MDIVCTQNLEDTTNEQRLYLLAKKTALVAAKKRVLTSLQRKDIAATIDKPEVMCWLHSSSCGSIAL